MILTVKVSDETYEKYGQQNKANPRFAIEQVIEKYAHVGSGKAVILTGEALAELQKLVGQLDNAEGVVNAVKKVSALGLDGVTLALTESQRKNVADLAKHTGQEVKVLLENKVKQALQNALGV